jgi:hypothetical protein
MPEQPILSPEDLNPHSLFKSLADAKHFRRVPPQLTFVDLGGITAWQPLPNPDRQTHTSFEAWLDGHHYHIEVDEDLHDEIGRRFITCLNEVKEEGDANRTKRWSLLAGLKRWFTKL